MTARRHHYLSQCYLKGFAQPRRRGKSHHILVFDRNGKTFTTNIINVAAEKDFHRIDVEGQTPDAFEQGMARFESDLAPALSRISDAKSLTNEQDRIVLFNFVALLAAKNPRHR